MTKEIPERFLRFAKIKEIGADGLERIQKAKFFVAGAGGLGSPALMYLAASGARFVTVADGDEVSLSNLSRQILHDDEAIGLNKAENAARALLRFNPEVQVRAVPEMLTEEKLDELLPDADIVLDCTDNLAARLMINRCAFRAKKPLVFGSAVRFFGQVSVFDFRKPDSPCYRCIFEEDDAANDQKASTLGVYSPLTGFVGTLQAAEALKIAAGLPSGLEGSLLMIDLLADDFQKVRVRRRKACPVCGA